MAGGRRPTIADVARRAVVDPVVSKVLGTIPASRSATRRGSGSVRQRPTWATCPTSTPAGCVRGAAPSASSCRSSGTPATRRSWQVPRRRPPRAACLLWTASMEGYPPDRYLSAVPERHRGRAAHRRRGRAGRTSPRSPPAGRPCCWSTTGAAGIDRWLVLEDDRAAALATDRLLAAGHRRIGFIGGREGFYWVAGGAIGYLAALERAGIEADPRLCGVADLTTEGGMRGRPPGSCPRARR